jgi:hypothetical protein
MSRSQGDDPGAVEKVLRTVMPGSKGHRDTSMDTIGWVILLGVVVVLLPLIPIVLVGWLGLKIVGFVRRNVLGD